MKTRETKKESKTQKNDKKRTKVLLEQKRKHEK